jgi:rare lipoprotein A
MHNGLGLAGCLALALSACALSGCAPSPDVPTTQLTAPGLAAKPQTNWSGAVLLPSPKASTGGHDAHSSGVATVQKAAVSAVEPLATQPSAARPLTLKAPLTGVGHSLTGIASYYWQDQMTATGERFDKRAMTAAHKTLPLGTKVRVTHVASGRSVVVRINDRGPYKPGRVIDLSEAAAEQLQMTSAGLAAVTVEIVK